MVNQKIGERRFFIYTWKEKIRLNQVVHVKIDSMKNYAVNHH